VLRLIAAGSFFGDKFNLTVTREQVLKNEIVGNVVSMPSDNRVDSIIDSVL
jgi:hypothetical protein